MPVHGFQAPSLPWELCFVGEDVQPLVWIAFQKHTGSSSSWCLPQPLLLLRQGRLALLPYSVQQEKLAFFCDLPLPEHSPSQPLRPSISCSCYQSSPPRWSVTWVSVQDILIWKRGSSRLTAFLSCASCCNFSCHLCGFSLNTETKPYRKGKNVPHLKWALYKECSPPPQASAESFPWMRRKGQLKCVYPSTIFSWMFTLMRFLMRLLYDLLKPFPTQLFMILGCSKFS